MKSTDQVLAQESEKALTVAGNGKEMSDDMKAFLAKWDKGELISPKLQRLHEERTVKIVKKLFAENPSLSKKEAALAILKNMPENIPSYSFAKLLEAGMKEWMSLKEQSPQD
ncbi:MAG TPA: hypothetical protein ENJ95_14020 [Bacteroidetes bacterium]|nr:hypothetical protein [Bacteroidota bacterium]